MAKMYFLLISKKKKNVFKQGIDIIGAISVGGNAEVTQVM